MSELAMETKKILFLEFEPGMSCNISNAASQYQNSFRKKGWIAILRVAAGEGLTAASVADMNS